jgi:hypothetical protein
MRTLFVAAAIGLTLGVAACSKPTQEKTGQDLKAVGADAATAAKDVAGAPAMKQLGSDIKQGASEAADKTKAAAGEAGEQLKAGAAKAGDQLKEGAKTAGDKTDAALNKAKDSAQK